ncbi:MAG: hypothetical protein OCU12_00055 [Methanophagales archaeon]|nr:hypothetical protein [Methanophagales archaeon]
MVTAWVITIPLSAVRRCCVSARAVSLVSLRKQDCQDVVVPGAWVAVPSSWNPRLPGFTL